MLSKGGNFNNPEQGMGNNGVGSNGWSNYTGFQSNISDYARGIGNSISSSVTNTIKSANPWGNNNNTFAEPTTDQNYGGFSSDGSNGRDDGNSYANYFAKKFEGFTGIKSTNENSGSNFNGNYAQGNVYSQQNNGNFNQGNDWNRGNFDNFNGNRSDFTNFDAFKKKTNDEAFVVTDDFSQFENNFGQNNNRSNQNFNQFDNFQNNNPNSFSGNNNNQQFSTPFD